MVAVGVQLDVAVGVAGLTSTLGLAEVSLSTRLGVAHPFSAAESTAQAEEPGEALVSE